MAMNKMKVCALFLGVLGGSLAQAALPPQYQRLVELQFVLSHEALPAEGRLVKEVKALSRGDYEVSFETSRGSSCRTRYSLVYAKKPAQDGLIGPLQILDLRATHSNCKSEPRREEIACRAAGSNPETDRNYVYYVVTITKDRESLPLRGVLVGTDRSGKRILFESVLDGTELSGFNEGMEFELKLRSTKLPNRATKLECIRPLGGGMSISN